MVKKSITVKKALKAFGQKIIRPPWGKQPTSTRLITSMLGYKVIAWNVVGEDWLELKAKSMADNLSKALTPECIILMHDRIYTSIMEKPQFDRTAAVDAINLLLETMTGIYRFVTVPELLKLGKPHIVIWNRPA